MTVSEPELIAMIAKESLVDPAQLTRDIRVEDTGITSLDLVILSFALEEKYDVVLAEIELPLDGTFGELLDFLLAKING